MIDRSCDLPSDLTAAAIGRSFAAETLVGFKGTWAQDCVLLVSELCTNAVLHGTGALHLRVLAVPGWVRVEVQDGSDLIPAARAYSERASTGRGIALVEALAADWGVHHVPSGKLVWFELGDRPDDVEAPLTEDRPREQVTIALLGAPIELVKSAMEHGESLLRDLMYVVLAGDLAERFPDGWTPPTLDLSPVLDVVGAAVGPAADLQIPLTEEAGNAARDRLAMVEFADGLARQGILLSPPSSVEIAACRRWALGEIHAQLAGAKPRPWQPPAGGDAQEAHEPLP